MSGELPAGVETLPATPVWDATFTVAPLVVIGSREEDGSYDLAPKHLAFPLSWEDHFGFVCTPRHATYWNCQRAGQFTVSYARPSQVVLASMAAAPRCEGDAKPSLRAIPTFPALEVDGELVADSYLFLECELDRIIDGFGANSLVCGRIVAAHARTEAIRREDRDDNEVVSGQPLLVYLNPGRYARIETSYAFPFPEGMTR